MNDMLLALAVAPGAGLMYYFYKRDEHEPEPRNKVLKVMGWGAAVSVVAIIVELILMSAFEPMAEPGSVLAVFLHAFVVAATVEELCKYWVVRATIYKDPEFDEPYDGVVYCVAASLGFAIVENILYVANGGFGVGIIRAILSVPAHALFGVFMGYYLGRSKFAPPGERTKYHLMGLAIAIFAHGAYDYVLMSGKPLLIITVLPMMGVFWALGLWKVKKLVNESPFAGATDNDSAATG
jgi:RsiW-degrading membrane proteinase PrsW (M82 family)